MMRHYSWIAALGIAAVVLAGCHPEPDVNTTVSNIPVSTQKVQAQLGQVQVAIAPLAEQQGYMRPEVSALLPMWKDGVADALQRSQVFVPGAAVTVNIRVKIIQLSQERKEDLSVITNAVASYEVVDATTGKTTWIRGISSSSTVTYQQEPIQSTRDRVSLNRAIQGNIAKFVQLYGHGEVEYPRVPANQLRIQQ